ncbi:hypothetical protein SNL152K_7280 [Streptomyces sp. NL15-2K]|nr:hypothetical protein SNL152K_7280 [Streptomyces sp. NL15-2K]
MLIDRPEVQRCFLGRRGRARRAGAVDLDSTSRRRDIRPV